MKRIKPITCSLTAILLAIGILTSGVAFTANASTPNSQIPQNLKGEYHQINTKVAPAILSFVLDDGIFFLSLGGLYDIDFGYSAEPMAIQPIDNGISFDCVLIPSDGRDESQTVSAHIELTQSPSGLYELQVASQQALPEPYSRMFGSTSYYKSEGNGIAGTVPAKLGEKVTIAGLIKAVSPYIFVPEMMATRLYLKTYSDSDLSDTEVVRQDERNRYLEYAWGSENQCMESKYWFTDDGNVLLVVNIHDATYQYPQNLRFFKFNRNEGTMRELQTVMSDKWPIGAEADRQGICYQVRYSSDGVIALVPETNGESFDVVTLKFDGQMFR